MNTEMTTGEWTGLILQVVATLAAAAAAIAAWQSVRGVSKERKADALWRADAHLKAIHGLVVEWFQTFREDRGRAFVVLMALRRELQVMTESEGELPRCVDLANADQSKIMPDDAPGLANAAMTEVEDARARMFDGEGSRP